MNGIKSVRSIYIANFSPFRGNLQEREGEPSSPRNTQPSWCFGANPADPSPSPVATFGGEPGSQVQILLSVNGTVVSPPLLPRSIFPPTSPMRCKPLPLALGSSAARGCSVNAAPGSTGHVPMLKTSRPSTPQEMQWWSAFQGAANSFISSAAPEVIPRKRFARQLFVQT